MLSMLIAGVILLTGAFLIGLGTICLIRPVLAERFLMSFASSATLHLVELAARVFVGGALFMHAPSSAYPVALSIAGMVLLGTSAILLFAPWRWHRRFALKTVPIALRFTRPMGAIAIVMVVLLGVAY